MTYDPVKRRVVLLDTDGATWAFDGTTWKRLAGRVVLGRDNGFLPATLGFDPQSRKLITITAHFVGEPDHIKTVFQTLRYEHRSWVALSTTTTPHSLASQRPEQRLVRAPGGRRLMLVVVTPPPTVGTVDPTTIRTETWKFNGHAWAKTTNSGPPPRANYSLAYDKATKRVVLFGGNEFGEHHDHIRDDIWSFDGSRWKQVQRDLPEPPDSVRCATA